MSYWLSFSIVIGCAICLLVQWWAVKNNISWLVYTIPFVCVGLFILSLYNILIRL